MTAPVRAMPVSFDCTQYIPSSTGWWDGSLPAAPLPALNPSWLGWASVGIFAPHQQEDAYHTQWFRAWNLPTPVPYY
ncbi:hypothetical protein AVEN_252337-1 [Araneus ventricosus]|uniref:Uncharacterized protein n=1 Tax=Araneus ventricosus TaxID=182803 RepID=A0A4Y2ARL2_ARAVE|nr:hypothetical protein AVEN_252337-1 [Araneus ventricosus]